MKTKEFVFEQDWTTQAGLRACVFYLNRFQYRLGYVAIPKGNKFYGLDDVNDIDVHGGVTYSGDGLGTCVGISDYWWWGFDCGHGGDKTGFNSKGTERSLFYVVAECEKLAKQIVEKGEAKQLTLTLEFMPRRKLT